jgi:hypothetical protein
MSESLSVPSPIWEALARPFDKTAIKWRQSGRATPRDGKFYARFVAYIDAQQVRERLDQVVPGLWSLHLEALPIEVGRDGEEMSYPVKATLSIRVPPPMYDGVSREDIGSGRDYKSASSDAFKRVAVHELYALKRPNWVQVDSDSRFAKPLEDPGTKYWGAGAVSAPPPAPPPGEPFVSPNEDPIGTFPESPPAVPSDVPLCPKCGGRMWDNRVGKRNPKAPDFKCRDRSCDGVVWPGKATTGSRAKPGRETVDDGRGNKADEERAESFQRALEVDEDDDLPF